MQKTETILLRKILALFILILNMAGMTVQGQPIEDESYYDIYNRRLEYFEEQAILQDKELSEIHGYKEFISWAEYFSIRNGENGSIKEYLDILNTYLSDESETIGDIELEWEYNSPEGLWPYFNNPNGSFANGSGQGLVVSLWVDSDDVDHIMAGTDWSGGLWETEDGGDNWYNITNNERRIQAISSIWVNPDDNNDIYITSFNGDKPGTYSNGLFHSHLENGVRIWEQNLVFVNEAGPSSVSADFYPTANKWRMPSMFVRHPTNPLIMYISTCNSLLMSVDGGDTWDEIIYITTQDYNNTGFSAWLGSQYFRDIQLDPNDPSTLYCVGPRLYRVENNGQDIIEITDNVLINNDKNYAAASRVDAHINFGDKIWFTVENHNSNMYAVIYNKIDNTYTHTPFSNISTYGGAYLHCEISPLNENKLIIGGNISYCLNLSNGVKFHLGYGPGLHNDIRDVFFTDDGSGNEIVILGTDGGITKKTNPELGSDWEYIANDGTNGIRNLDVQGFDCSASGEQIIAMGTSHDGLILKKEGEWYKIFQGGDMQAVIIDPENPNNIYTTRYATTELWYSNNMGLNSGGFYNYNGSNYVKPPILFLHPDDKTVLYAGEYKQLLKFNTESIINLPTTYPFENPDTYDKYQNIREYASCEKHSDILFLATDRYFPQWKTEWKLTNPNHWPYQNAFFKVDIHETGSVTYTDLSENLFNGLIGGTVTGIAIVPTIDETVIWTTFGTTSTSEDPALAQKVYRSFDFGETWEPMANGLPPDLPVSDIIYNKQTGQLFLINDLGIYIFDRIGLEWLNLTNDLPPMTFNLIHFDKQRNKIMVGSRGRGIWEADCPCIYNDVDMNIEDSQEWDFPLAINSDIVIQTGAVLTIKSNIYMPEGAKIIVKRNAQLILDGGLITNACSGPWQGLLVYGNAGQPQSNEYQGRVDVINGGTIENAVCGISTIKYSIPNDPGGYSIPDYYYTGGIVRCNGAIFKNNQTAVKFWDYSFDESESFFRDCQFITGDQVLATIVPGNFLEINSISGIKIQASSFTDMRTMANPIHLTSGILAYNGHFEVFNSASQNCAFTGLYYGIKAYAHGPGKFISVKNSIFDDNFRGIYINGMSNAEITDNNFNINSPYSSLNGGYGLYLDYSTAYKVEDNNFYHEGETAIGLGLVVNQSGSDPNQIYRNYFSLLECGMDLQGENRAKDGIGLQLKCNEYSLTLMDKIVTWDELFITGTAGIAKDQGSSSSNPEDMAGNLFYVPGPSNNDYDDILNEANHITYYYPLNNENNDVIPVDYTHNTVEAVGVLFSFGDWTFENGCPPSEEPGGGGGIGVIKGKMAVADNKADSTENILALLIDGGNTEAVQTDVDNSAPPETMQVYSDLMAKSPYLSDTVVSTAIEKEDVLPGAMLRDILVANPNTAKSEKLMQKLDERWDPLPEYMKAQILAGRSIVSIREETESRLAAFKLERAKHFNALARYYINDTVDPVGSMDSLKALYENENSLSAKYGLAFISLEQGAWDEGLEVLNDIPVQFELTAKESNKQSQMLLYYNLLSGIAQEGKSIFEVDEAQKSTLTGIEAANAGSISAYSRNILLALGEIDYEEPIILPDMLKSSSTEAEYEDMLSKVAEAPSYITVQPNPAKDYIILAYELEKEGGATVDIHNINANLEFTKNLTGKQDQLTIDTRGWKAGVYIVTLKINGKLAESVKFTVID